MGERWNDQAGDGETMSGCTTVKEWVPATEGKWTERTYTDDEIEDIFGDDEYDLTLGLLRRAQAAEAEVERLRRLLGERD